MSWSPPLPIWWRTSSNGTSCPYRAKTSCQALAWTSTESMSVPSMSKMTARVLVAIAALVPFRQDQPRPCPKRDVRRRSSVVTENFSCETRANRRGRRRRKEREPHHGGFPMAIASPTSFACWITSAASGLSLRDRSKGPTPRQRVGRTCSGGRLFHQSSLRPASDSCADGTGETDDEAEKAWRRGLQRAGPALDERAGGNSRAWRRRRVRRSRRDGLKLPNCNQRTRNRANIPACRSLSAPDVCERSRLTRVASIWARGMTCTTNIRRLRTPRFAISTASIGPNGPALRPRSPPLAPADEHTPAWSQYGTVTP